MRIMTLAEHHTLLLRKLKNDESGSVMVEAGFYFVIFFLLCALLSDLSIVFLDKGRMERVNYSLSSIMQQRSRFFQESEDLSDSEAQQLFDVAGKLFENSRLAGRDYSVDIDAIYFADGATRRMSKTLSFKKSKGQCSVRKYEITSADILSLAVWDPDKSHWLPVYQVTLCIAGTQSLFKKLGSVVGMTVGDLSIVNAVIPR